MATHSTAAPIELDIRIARGNEADAIRALEALGAQSIEQRPDGELRVAPSGPLRPFLDVEQALVVYAVRGLPDIDLKHMDSAPAFEAAMELVALVLALWRGRKPTTMRVTAAPGVVGDGAAIWRLAILLTRRLGLTPAAIAPDVVLIVRRRGSELELCARLPLKRRKPERPQESV